MNRVILQGDVLERLKDIPEESIDCVITSPPYYGLRDYGHDGQIGLETNVKDYIDKLMSVMRGLRRVLKPTGSIFWNLGDTYAGTKISNARVRTKSLFGIPDRFKIRCIDEGYIVRNDIIWHRPNHMPFSGSDRLTNSYERVFFITKSKKYFFNLKPIREPSIEYPMPKTKPHNHVGQKQLLPGNDFKIPDPKNLKVKRPVIKYNTMHIKQLENRKWHNIAGQRTHSLSDNHTGPYTFEGKCINHPDGKNPGDVMSIHTVPNKSIHSAAFPPELPRRLISCACPKNGIVLDPFAGSGTTLIEAAKQGKGWIGIELNAEYVSIISKLMRNHRKVIANG